MRAKSGPEIKVKGVKKMNTKKLLLSVLFVVASTFALSAGLTAANAGEQPALSARLNLGKDIAIKIETNLGANVTSATANFAWAGSLGEYDDEVIGEKGTDGEYLFTYRGLSAQHMDKTVNVTVNYSVAGIEQTPVSGTFCVKDYLNALKEKTFKDEGYTEYSLAKLKTLANDTLLYGGAAQKYLDETAENTVGDGVYGSDIYFEDLTPVSSAIQGDDLAWKTGLRFDCNAQPFGSFALNFDYNEVKVEIYADNEKKAEVVPKSQNGRLIALYEDFSVLDYEKEYTFKVIVDGNEKGSLTYSLATLVLSKQSATDASAKLINSFYSYCASACEYEKSSSFTDYVLIEAETGTKTGGGELAASGMVAGYMSGGKFYRNFKAGDTLSFNYFAEYDYTSAEIYMIGSSGCVAEYDTDNKPKVVSEMKANELFTLSVNEEEKSISDNAVFEGKSAAAGDYALFGNRTAVKLCKTTLKRGTNQVLFTFKDSPYKNQDNSTASANYDTLMIVLNGKEELPVETVTVGEKIEMENLSFIHGTDAERAGNTQLHPGYTGSNVSSAFSNSAFVKDIRKGGVLTFNFTVEEDCTLSLVLCATSTSTATVDLSKIFNVCLNGEALAYSDSTIAARSGNDWTPSETTVARGIQLKAGKTYVLTFESIITAEKDGSVFYDYIKFVA